MVSMRDEAHRFSRRLHHKQEKKKILTSWFDDIEGIGGVTRTNILKNLDRRVEQLVFLDLPQIMDLLQVSKKVAERIIDKLKS